jgi:hypothetical protein
MNQPKDPDPARFWTRGTLLQIILLGVAGVAFLLALMAIISTEFVH